jgi:hypothetical protein
LSNIKIIGIDVKEFLDRGGRSSLYDLGTGLTELLKPDLKSDSQAPAWESTIPEAPASWQKHKDISRKAGAFRIISITTLSSKI